MIEVFAKKRGGYYRLYVTGHADYAPGHDIVCAGVSALTGALLAFAQERAECRHLRQMAGHGELFLCCRGGLGSAFDAVMLGLVGISRAYPGHVRVQLL